MFDFLKYLPVLGFIARISGAVLGFIEFYILIFLVLYLASDDSSWILFKHDR